MDQFSLAATVDLLSKQIDVDIDEIGKGIGFILPDMFRDHCPD